MSCVSWEFKKEGSWERHSPSKIQDWVLSSEEARVGMEDSGAVPLDEAGKGNWKYVWYDAHL